MPINTNNTDAPSAHLARPLKRLATPLRAVAAACAITAAGLALAENSPYYVGVAQSFGHESNLLRLNDGATAPAGYSKADTVSSTSLLAGIDQPFGRQRLRGDVALRANRYNDNDVFNNQSYTANLALDWATVNRLSGTLSGGATRSMSSFNLQESGFLNAKNFEDTQALDATVQLGVVTQYSLLARAGHREVSNSLERDSVQARNFKQDTGSLGLRWKPSGALVLGADLRTTKGRYPKFGRNPVDNSYLTDSYTRNDIDLTAYYQPTGLSTLNARLSSGKTDYDRATQRNFSGLTGSLNWGWQVTGKLRVNTTLSRDTGQDSYLVSTITNTPTTADYSRVNTTLRVGAEWAVTSKIAVTSSVTTSQRDLVTTLPAQLSPNVTATGRERYSSLAVGARWAPTRASLVGCSANTDRISGSGSQAGSNIKGTGLSCYAQLTLQ